MSKLAARLFVAVAVAAGGFLAVTNAGTVPDPLPPVPTPSSFASPPAARDADDLSEWQETRLKAKPSNTVPAKAKKK